MTSDLNILVVDDDNDILLATKLLLKRTFSRVITVNCPEEIPSVFDQAKIDLVLLDMNFTPGRNEGDEGFFWLRKIQELSPNSIIILMTAFGDVSLAVKAIQSGATDFVLKPWQNEKLLATLNAASKLIESRLKIQQLEKTQEELQRSKTIDIIGSAPPMLKLDEIIEKAAPTDTNILILGENGTGKELIAQDIHKRSSRANKVILSVDLGAVAETLFESELFGHIKGAFTDARKDRAGRFLAASGGTLFLDEIGNLPLHLQAKLLRVLETRRITPVGSDNSIEVDVRLICATNMPLAKMVESGQFRADLFYRINTIELNIAPLRERTEDIPALCEYFLGQYSKKYRIPPKTFSNTAINHLKLQNWPGNVRELSHVIERAVILSTGKELNIEDFNYPSSNTESLSSDDLNLDRIEKQTIEKALSLNNGNISHTAQDLGITRPALYRRLKRHDL